MFFILLFVGIVAIFIMLGWNELGKRDERKLLINDKLKEIGFKSSKFFIDERSNSAIAYDKDKNKFAVINTVNNILNVSQFDSSEILQSEIVEDNQSISKTSRSSQVGGALVGAALTGGVGAIIGGLSANRIEKKEVRSLYLKVIVNDIDEPVRTIKFLHRDSPIEKKNPIYQHYFTEIDKWHNMIKVLIKQSNQLNSN